METTNKKAVFLGDSITHGSGASDEAHRYTNVFAELAGCEIFVDGISGTRIAPQKGVSPNPEQDLDFIGRVDALPKEADFIVVFGGTNDFGHGDAPFGEMEDREATTFYGAMHVLCQKLIVKYPTATIVFMTPLHRLSENEVINERGLPCKPLIEYVKAIREVCEYYSLPVLDLYKYSGLQPAVKAIQETYMPDGLHPSDLGAKKIASMLKQFIQNL